MLGILVFHTVPAILPGGFIGVDVFFVLSGFLIAASIANDAKAGTFSFREFYLRRMQRLVPNAVLTILVTALLWFFVLTPSATVKTAKLGLAALLGLSNVHLWRAAAGYWTGTASSLPLLHTWALAVEIQFYVVFPAVLWLLLRRPRRLLQVTLGALVVVSLALAVAGAKFKPEAAFYFLPTRAWQFLVGAVLAIAWFHQAPRDPEQSLWSRRWHKTGGWLGLAMILAGFALISNGQQLFGLVALAPTVGAVLLIICIAQGHNILARLLSWRPGVAMGRASYSLFLWHLPLIVLGTTYASFVDWPHYVGVIGGATAGVALAVVAYNWVEKPLRRRAPRRTLRLSIAGTGFVLCAVLVGLLSFWKPVADSEDLFDQVVFRGFAYDVSWDAARDEARSEFIYDDVDYASVEAQPPKVWEDGGIIHYYGGETPSVVVVGSSHAMMYGGQIDDICRELGISVAFFSFGAIPAIPVSESYTSVLAAFFAARSRWIAEWRPEAVLLIDRWDAFYGVDTLAEELHDYLLELQSSTHNVIALTQPPELRLGASINLREYVTWYYKRHSVLPSISAADWSRERQQSDVEILEAEAQNNAALKVIRADQYFCNPDGSVRYFSGRDFFYLDEDHLAEAGAMQLHDALKAAIAEACSIRDSDIR